MVLMISFDNENWYQV